MDNPFNPSFGIQPTVLLDRQTIFNPLVANVKKLNTPYRTTLIYGARGTGKTVFMNAVGRKISDDRNWISIHLPIGDNMLGRLVSLLYSKSTSRIQKLLDNISGINFSIGGFAVNYSTNHRAVTSYQELLEKILRIMKDQHQHALVMIDEARETKAMVELISTYQVLMAENLPISLMMTGLPKNVQELQKNHVLTFLLRSGRVSLSPLNIYDIQAQYRKALVKRDSQISPAVIHRLAFLADGYAYAFQLLGYLVWESADEHITDQTIDEIIPDYQALLSRNAYSKMFEELSPTDQQFIITMALAKDDPVSTTYLSEKLHKSTGYIGVYRRRLIDSQIIASAGYGKLRFALPLFKRFVIDDGQYFAGV